MCIGPIFVEQHDAGHGVRDDASKSLRRPGYLQISFHDSNIHTYVRARRELALRIIIVSARRHESCEVTRFVLNVSR